MKFVSAIITISVALILISCTSYKIKPDQKATLLTIGSGSKNAMYYPVATAICDIFNKYNKDKNTRCEARLSKGAEYNLRAVENGDFSMGISQANLQRDAYVGNNKFLNKPHKNLRTLFRVHNEYLTIIAKKDLGIDSFHDLRGKKVNIGNPGSGSRILFSQMIKKLKWDFSDFQDIYEESGSNINKVLCPLNKADAAVYLVGHPNESFRSMLDNCGTELVPLSNSEIDLFNSISSASFHETYIPAQIYNNSSRIKTFASKTILTASSKLDPEIVRNFVEIISKHKKELIVNQASLSVISFSEREFLDLAPLHEGLN
jgi:TRAP transporter TAXI family solute receptor